MNLIIFGPPGAGKGTQAVKIAEKYSVAHISTGDILRGAVKNGTELGLKAKEFMDKGELVPDELVIGIIKDRVKEKDCENGFLFDGFPRTIPQAEALRGSGIVLQYVVEIAVDDDEIIRRMSGRRVHPASMSRDI